MPLPSSSCARVRRHGQAHPTPSLTESGSRGRIRASSSSCTSPALQHLQRRAASPSPGAESCTSTSSTSPSPSRPRIVPLARSRRATRRAACPAARASGTRRRASGTPLEGKLPLFEGKLPSFRGQIALFLRANCPPLEGKLPWSGAHGGQVAGCPGQLATWSRASCEVRACEWRQAACQVAQVAPPARGKLHRVRGQVTARGRARVARVTGNWGPASCPVPDRLPVPEAV